MNTNNLISWTSTIDYNGYTPVEGIIIGDQLIAATEGRARQALMDAIHNAAKNNAQNAITALDSMILTLQKLNRTTIPVTNGGKNSYSYSQKKIQKVFDTQEKMDESNLLVLWERVQAQIFGNTIPTSLTVGFSSGNANLRLGYAQDEAKYIERVNSLKVSIDSDLNFLIFNQDTDQSDMSLQNAQQVFERHYNGLIQSITQERSNFARSMAYVWLWYYKRSAYREAQNKRPNKSFGDILVETGKAMSGVAFEAFCQHMYAYHNMNMSTDDFGVNLNSITDSIENEEGMPNFLYTISQAGYGDTPFFASGDIVMIDADGNIKLNTQVKSTLTAKYNKTLKHKSLLGLCLELKSLLVNPELSISDKSYEKLLTTALRPSGSALDSAVQNTLYDLMDNLGKKQA